ncbi:BspA family leucine-rich repeat surface protein [Helicobacter sp. MIT 05-5293]|uniref:BspA family leucine-rich repeat surface protein n=1 Tax=Helicobacter sp. MIT 05-5293 TaxID=1548149 RepID=UPI00051DAF8A|nr:BspA family leucine-rich repeat surface protein [Helicobacter sp. MIT 05-5293]TLD80812.1 BspA family leucine-rich repeat surface protein [Helicobacter sp. MIT 05-5293]
MYKTLFISIITICTIFNGCADSSDSESRAIHHPKDRLELVNLLGDESIKLGQIDTSAITDMSYLFARIPQEKCNELFEQFLKSVDAFVILRIEEIAAADKTYKPTDSNTESIKAALIQQWQDNNQKCTHTAYSRQDFDGIESWNVSNVKDMSYLFAGVKEFDENLGLWNVGKVENMKGAFMKTTFNRNIESWDTSNVQDMSLMFADSHFNQPLNAWNVGGVKDMSFMFYKSRFNQNIESWDISHTENMSFMFARAKTFAQSLESWGQKLNPNALTHKMFEDSYLESNNALPKWYHEPKP